MKLRIIVSEFEWQLHISHHLEVCDLNFEILHLQLEYKPEGFPFEIIDTPGERTLLLQRKFENETIQVEVDSAPFDDEDEEAAAEANDDDEEESSARIRLPMVVSVAKSDGACLEFGVSAYADEIVIDSLSIKQAEGSDNELAYEGPDFE